MIITPQDLLILHYNDKILEIFMETMLYRVLVLLVLSIVIMLCAIPLSTSVIVHGFQLIGMTNLMPGRALIDAAQHKCVKYMAKCVAIEYDFLFFSFSSLGELEDDALTLLKRIRKFSMTQDIRGTRCCPYI
ncbi:hypothetical protein Tco_0601673 [Tanacetum coccineum]